MKQVFVEKQVVIIYAVVNNYLKKIPVEDIREYEKDLFIHLDESHPDILASIRDTKELTAENEQALKAVLKDFAEKFMQQLNLLNKNDLNVVVFNFIDMLSHARTESKMVRELANNESAYRSITLSWFRHSVIAEFFRWLAQTDYKVIVTTDHGSIRCTKPVKIVGDRNTNTNLRYKLGKSLGYDAKDLFVVKDPGLAQLPSPNLSTSYVFATGDSFFAYPNNYNYYVSYYKDTFQHGGISMEEMIIPLITMTGKKR